MDWDSLLAIGACLAVVVLAVQAADTRGKLRQYNFADRTYRNQVMNDAASARMTYERGLLGKLECVRTEVGNCNRVVVELVASAGLERADNADAMNGFGEQIENHGVACKQWVDAENARLAEELRQVGVSVVELTAMVDGLIAEKAAGMRLAPVKTLDELCHVAAPTGRMTHEGNRELSNDDYRSDT